MEIMVTHVMEISVHASGSTHAKEESVSTGTSVLLAQQRRIVLDGVKKAFDVLTQSVSNQSTLVTHVEITKSAMLEDAPTVSVLERKPVSLANQPVSLNVSTVLFVPLPKKSASHN
jgi:hypothetical protein